MADLWMVPIFRKLRHEWMTAILRASIAMQIRGLRKSRNWSQERLAKALSTKQSAVSRLENPLRSNPSVRQLIKIANVFDVALVLRFADWTTFVTGQGIIGPPPPGFDQEAIS